MQTNQIYTETAEEILLADLVCALSAARQCDLYDSAHAHTVLEGMMQRHGIPFRSQGAQVRRKRPLRCADRPDFLADQTSPRQWSARNCLPGMTALLLCDTIGQVTENADRQVV